MILQETKEDPPLHHHHHKNNINNNNRNTQLLLTDLQFLELSLNGEPVTGGVRADRELVKGVLQPGPGLGVHLTVLVVVLHVLLIALQQVLLVITETFKHSEGARGMHRLLYSLDIEQIL